MSWNRLFLPACRLLWRSVVVVKWWSGWMDQWMGVGFSCLCTYFFVIIVSMLIWLCAAWLGSHSFALPRWLPHWYIQISTNLWNFQLWDQSSAFSSSIQFRSHPYPITSILITIAGSSPWLLESLAPLTEDHAYYRLPSVFDSFETYADILALMNIET